MAHLDGGTGNDQNRHEKNSIMNSFGGERMAREKKLKRQ